MQETLTTGLGNVFKEIKWNDQLTAMFKHVENKEYSQVGRLMKDGKLGERGYIFGTIVEGITQTNIAGQKAHERMQVFMGEIIKETMRGQHDFMMGNLQIKAQRTKIIEDFLKDTKQQSADLMKQQAEVLAAFRTADFEKPHEVKKLEMMKDFVTQTTKDMTRMIEVSIQEASKLLPRADQDDELMKHIVDSNQAIMLALNSTMQMMSQQNSEFNKGVTHVLGGIAKDIVSMVKGDKGSQSTVKIEELPNGDAPKNSNNRKIIGFFEGRSTYHGDMDAPAPGVKQLEFKKGEKLKVLEEAANEKYEDWVKVENDREEVGYVPSGFGKVSK